MDGGSRLRPFSEKGGAYAYHRGPFLDGQLEIVGHAHGQRIEGAPERRVAAQEASGSFVARSTGPEGGAYGRGVFHEGRHGHEPAQAHPGARDG